MAISHILRMFRVEGHLMNPFMHIFRQESACYGAKPSNSIDFAAELHTHTGTAFLSKSLGACTAVGGDSEEDSGRMQAVVLPRSTEEYAANSRASRVQGMSAMRML